MEVKKTSLLEKVVAIIAPHHCISCGVEDNILCEGCRLAEHMPLESVCVKCTAPTSDWRLCTACAQSTGLDHVFVSGLYEGNIAKIVRLFKFERAKAAYIPLGRMMLQVLPYGEWVVVAVPTAPKRIRQRGYDQAGLLARYIAGTRGLALSPALLRVQDTRQVGTNRVQRQKQSTQMFAIAAKANARGAHILLVDDVCTTSATLSAAAQVLRASGAASVDAVVVAMQPLKNKSK
jgi:ComF family protein